MKRLVRMSLSMLLALTFVLYGSPAARAEETTCQGFLGDVTVDNLLVPPDASCILEGTKVMGTIKVENNASLAARMVVVIGNVQAEGAQDVKVLSLSTVGGSIQIKQGGSSEIDEVNVTGDIQFESNNLALGATHNQVGGSVQAFQNTGGVNIANNAIGGDVQVFQNTGGANIAHNGIDGNLQCKENDPPPTGGNNVVQGNEEDQCASLTLQMEQQMFLSFVFLNLDAANGAAPPTPPVSTIP